VVVVLDEAMRQLCQTSKTFLGVIAMLCIILSAILYVANYFVNSGKPKTSKKPLLWLASVAVFVLAVLGIAIYILLPPVMSLVMGSDSVPLGASCYPDYHEPPYCGDDTCRRANWTGASNCTCLMS
jgi:hypothetical protein